MNNINIIAGSAEGMSAAANNNNQNNNIETLKGMITAGHDGAKDFGCTEFGRDWCFRWGEYLININRNYGVWQMHIFHNYRMAGDYDANLTPNWGGQCFSGRWSKTLVANMAKFILDTIADYESVQEEIRMEEEWEKMDECVAEFQPIFEDYVQDLRYVADNYGKLRTKCDCFAAKEIVKKIKDLGETLLRALGNITGCWMVEEDGYWLDTSSLEEWYRDECGRLFYDDYMHLSDIEHLIEALDYMITESDMPLGFDKETLDFELGGYEDETSFLGLVADYPSYIWDELRDFISTYYHYAYCA